MTHHASNPSAVFLLLKHLDLSKLKQEETTEIIEMLRHAPMDPNEMVTEVTYPARQKKEIRKSLLDRALETLCSWERNPAETENGMQLILALLDRGVPPDLSLLQPNLERARNYLPLTIRLIEHYQDPDDNPSLPSQMLLGVRLLEIIKKGRSSRQCIEDLMKLVSSSSLQKIEGVHPAVWLGLQSTPRYSERLPMSGQTMGWGAGWAFDGSNSEGLAFFKRMAKSLEEWATKELDASDPQLLLFDACLTPWAGVSKGMKARWFYSPEHAERAAQSAVSLAQSLPPRAMAQAISSLLGTSSVLLEKEPSSTEEAIARVFIEEGVPSVFEEPACSLLTAGKALWGNEGSSARTAGILGQKKGGAREGLKIWGEHISQRSGSHIIPTEWLGVVLDASERNGHDVISQVREALPVLESVMDKAEELKSDLLRVSLISLSLENALRVFKRVEKMVLEAQMDIGLPAAPAPGTRVPGTRL